MIEISLSTAFILYLGLSLLFILFLWIYSNVTENRRPPIPLCKKLIRCEYCAHPYLPDYGDSLTRCPQCHSLNQQKKK